MIKITDEVFLSEEELHWHFICASGPGGQHVNKVATAAQLHFNIKKTTSLSPQVKFRLEKIVGNRVNALGELVLTGRRHRSQLQNREEVIARLVHFISLALYPPKPRKKTKPSRGAKERRLAAKDRRSRLKKTRQLPNY